MGNLAYLIPSENLEDFTFDKITSLIENEFPNFDVVGGLVRFKNKPNRTSIGRYYMEDECYLLEDPHLDIEYLRNDCRYAKAEELEHFFKMGLDLTKVLCLTHSAWFIENNSVIMFLKDYFKGYVFDEGIHPDFIGPDYVSKNTLKYKKENSLLKKIEKMFKGN